MSDFESNLAAFDRSVARSMETCSQSEGHAIHARPRPGFTINEIMEHVAMTNSGIGSLLLSLIGQFDGKQPYAIMEDEEIPYLFERAAEPPGQARPSEELRSKEEALDHFSQSAAKISRLVVPEPAKLRLTGRPHPLFGAMDGVQWLIFATAHVERHRSEIIGLQNLIAGRQ